MCNEHEKICELYETKCVGLEVKICKEKRKIVDESSCLRFEIECGQKKIMDPLCQKECDLKE